MNQPIKVLIADDHPILRSGVKLMIESEDDMTVVGEAGDGREAVALTHSLGPDVVVMDISMPQLTGIEATREIKSERPETNVVGLTMHSDDRYFFELLNAGAAGYVVKGGAPSELIDAIRAAARGDAYIHPSLVGKLIHGFAQRAQRSHADSTSVQLTERETEVVRLIADGRTGREIAEALVISPNTVDRHRTNIMTKLHMHNKAELVRYAIEQGLV